MDVPVARTLNTQSERLCIVCSRPVYPSLPKVCLIPVCYMLIFTCLPSLKMTTLPSEIYFPSMKLAKITIELYKMRRSYHDNIVISCLLLN